ncbi:unnamed protein product [Paramecium pentaurelia]|uniref:Uncharacterized protein n=1 Tax=Paramecium pentaurelia TaxID=43138 RepID=A0A8S1XBS5_9CILI|nr:unnamed protein product [Paramecium pentaurelia]
MSKKPQYDLMCKFLIIGSAQVGKTNLLTRFIDNVYSESHLTTVGVDFKFKEMKVNGKIMKMQIWDTAGQEKFRTLTQNYYKYAHGVLLVYAIDDIQSFKEITFWMNSLKQHGKTDLAIILIANKCDLEEKRTISKQQGEDLANQLAIEYFETSAKTGKNVNEVFQRLADLAESLNTQKISLPNLTEDNSYKINLTSNTRNKKKRQECC